ncbi:KH domain-containing protein HEN4 [Linum grandiflorum]
MSSQLTPAKRPNDENPIESNGKAKLQKTLSSSEQPLRTSNGNVNFRVLCPASKVDRVIGKAGLEEMGFCVRVEEAVAGCDDRVVVIESCRKDTEDVNAESKEAGDGEANAAAEDDKKDSIADGTCALKAMLCIFERLVEAETGTEGGHETNGKPPTIVLRLLVPSKQVGCIVGKGGSVIKLIVNESGAQMRIVPRDKIPICVSAREDVILITGEIDAVRRALHSVCMRLLNPRQDHELVTATSSGLSSQSVDHLRPQHRVPEIGVQGQKGPATDVLTLRLAIPDGKAGVVIGKGGSMVKLLLQETGCDVVVMDPVPDCQDRVVVISGSVHPGDRISGVQDAVIRLLAKILKGRPDNQDKIVVARLLITSDQIGCLLGKAGSIMEEMRMSTGAYIRILPKNQIPKCASEGEEVLQVINGEFERVVEAMLQITTRLQLHFFGDTLPSHLGFVDRTPLFPLPPPYLGRREISPSFIPFRNSSGMLDDPSPFMYSLHRPGMPPHLSERKPWGPPQGLPESSAPVGLPDFLRPPHGRISDLEGPPAITTSTTMEVVVPRSLVPVIYGEDGACLMQIRQISEAKIIITDPKPGAIETVIIISGTPEQTNAAQSLIQAFVMSEQESI